MKMYILVRESLPLGIAMVAVAHASLATYLRFAETPEVASWLAGPFYKVVCRVSDQAFEQAKAVPDFVVISESKLGGVEVALGFKPREKWPKAFQYFPLYR